MSARSFVVARGEGRDRQYFAGVDTDHGMIAAATLIFDALFFDTEAEALQAVAFLDAGDVPGFAVSEITSGTSPNIAGEQA